MATSHTKENSSIRALEQLVTIFVVDSIEVMTAAIDSLMQSQFKPYRFGIWRVKIANYYVNY